MLLLQRGALAFHGTVGGFALAPLAIFGGLSAPSDRYQARVAWLVPMVVTWWYACGAPAVGVVASRGRPTVKGRR